MIYLSIIIPFYNVERHIKDCLESVTHQDIPLSYYEIICVNDASPDHSRNIVLEYMKQYPNIRLIEHEQNKKLGAARNTGRSIAQGKYIWNVDSDDKIAQNCLKGLITQCEKNNLDVLLFNFKNSNDSLGNRLPNSECINGLEFIEKYAINNIASLCPVWKQIYRKQFLDSNGIFSPEINMGEDVPYSFSALTHAKRVMSINEYCYYYTINEESLTGNKRKLNYKELYEKSIIDSVLINKVAHSIPKSYGQIRIAINDVARYTFLIYKDYYSCMSMDNQAFFKKLCKTNLLNDIISISKIISKKNLMQYILFIIK